MPKGMRKLGLSKGMTSAEISDYFRKHPETEHNIEKMGVIRMLSQLANVANYFKRTKAPGLKEFAAGKVMTSSQIDRGRCRSRVKSHASDGYGIWFFRCERKPKHLGPCGLLDKSDNGRQVMIIWNNGKKHW